MDGSGPARRRYYGIAEVADALGLNRQLVTVWRRRRSWGMPEPDDELASGPLWRGATIEPWIEATRARLAVTADAAPLGPDAARRWGRRLFRLLALLLEDEPRPALIARALRDLDQAAAAVAAAAPSAERDAVAATAEAIRAAAGAAHPVPGPDAGSGATPGAAPTAAGGPDPGPRAIAGAAVGPGQAADPGAGSGPERVLDAGLAGVGPAIRALGATGAIEA